MFREIYLVRHGESEANLARRIQGWGDTDLTPRGRQEAASVPARLARSGIRHIWSSDLARAAHTAEIIGEALGIKPILDSAFREINLGRWEGMLLSDVERDDPDALNRWREDCNIPPYHEMESITALRDRLIDGLRRVADAGTGPSVVVSHGGAISVILTHILDLDLKRVGQMPVFNASVSLVLCNGALMKMASFNETGHLPPRPAHGFDAI